MTVSSMVKAVVVSALLITGFAPSGQASDKKIIYAVFWAGCEDVCRGLQDYIKTSDLNAELIINDLGGDRSKFQGAVKQARDLQADLVVTWGTSATLGITGTLADVKNNRFINDIPVVFTMVSDPVRSKIIESYDRTGRKNITGTRNRVPEKLNIKTMRKIKPSFKRLGIIYNQSEPNSLSKVAEIKGLQTALKFELVAVELDLDAGGKPQSQSIPDRVKDLKDQGVDFIYLGSSIFLEKHMDLFTASAVENGLPVLSPYENLVRDAQAYLSVAARDYDVGLLAGTQISKILVDGLTPGDIAVKSIDQYAYVINMKTAKKINLFPSVDILQIAEIVE